MESTATTTYAKTACTGKEIQDHNQSLLNFKLPQKKRRIFSSKVSLKTNWLQKILFGYYGHLSGSWRGIFDYYKTVPETQKERYDPHRYFVCYRAQNPLYDLTFLFQAGMVAGIIYLLIPVFLSKDWASLLDWDNYIILIISIILFKIFKPISIKKHTDRGSLYFDRVTGQITWWYSNEEKKTLFPFTDFIPCYRKKWGAAGETTYHLGYQHKTRDLYFEPVFALADLVNIYLWHKYFCQFMDVTQPLPDVPHLEEFRHLDPTTATFDKETERPPRKWRDMSDDDYGELAVRLSEEARQSFKEQCWDIGIPFL